MTDHVATNPAFLRARRSSATTIPAPIPDADEAVSALTSLTATKLGYPSLKVDESSISWAQRLLDLVNSTSSRLPLHSSSARRLLDARSWLSGGDSETVRGFDTWARTLQWTDQAESASPLSWTSSLTLARGMGLEQLETRIRTLLAERSLEDGRIHDAEIVLDRAAAAGAADSEWAMQFVRATASRQLPDTLVLLARVGLPSATKHRAQLLTNCLADEDLSIRAAAVQALELWGDKDALVVAGSHKEEIPWIRDYLATVIHDIRSSDT